MIDDSGEFITLTTGELFEIERPSFYTPDGVGLSIAEWLECCEELDKQRRIRETYIGHYRVSTVYIGVDMAFWNPFPLIFETMVFGPEGIIYCDRYPFREIAKAGHRAIVRQMEHGAHRKEWIDE